MKGGDRKLIKKLTSILKLKEIDILSQTLVFSIVKKLSRVIFLTKLNVDCFKFIARGYGRFLSFLGRIFIYDIIK